MSDFSIQKIINEAVKKSEHHVKDKWYATDLGKCLRGAYYARLGNEKTEPDERTLRVFMAGNLFEQWVIETIKKGSDEYTFEQPQTIYLKEYDLGCRPDLIVTHKATGKKWVYELKSCHSDKFWWMEKRGTGPDEHYLMQTWCEMLVTGIDEARLMYVSKDDLCIAEFILHKGDTAIASKVMKELQILNDCWKTQTLPPREEAIVDGKINWKAKYCPFHHLCMDDPNWLKVAESELQANKPKKGRWKKISN